MIDFFFGALFTMVVVGFVGPFFVEPRRKRDRRGRFTKRSV